MLLPQAICSLQHLQTATNSSTFRWICLSPVKYPSATSHPTHHNLLPLPLSLHPKCNSPPTPPQPWASITFSSGSPSTGHHQPQISFSFVHLFIFSFFYVNVLGLGFELKYRNLLHVDWKEETWIEGKIEEGKELGIMILKKVGLARVSQGHWGPGLTLVGCHGLTRWISLGINCRAGSVFKIILLTLHFICFYIKWFMNQVFIFILFKKISFLKFF